MIITKKKKKKWRETDLLVPGVKVASKIICSRACHACRLLCWFTPHSEFRKRSFDFETSRDNSVSTVFFFGDVDRNSIEEMAIDVAKRNEETSRNSGAQPITLSANLVFAVHRKRQTHAHQSGKLFACFRFTHFIVTSLRFSRLFDTNQLSR